MDDEIDVICNKISNNFKFKVVVYDKSIFPIYEEVGNLIFIVSNTFKNIFSVDKKKCQVLETKNKNSYYKLIPSQEDIDLNKIPIRPIGCSPSTHSSLNLGNLSKHEKVSNLLK